MKRHNQNGLLLAERLRRHPAVERVWYPKWEFSEAYEAVRRPDGGWGALLTFLPKHGEHEVAGDLRPPGVLQRAEPGHGLHSRLPFHPAGALHRTGVGGVVRCLPLPDSHLRGPGRPGRPLAAAGAGIGGTVSLPREQTTNSHYGEGS